MIGLCGAHRTGKTSLAKLYAEKNGIKFVETSVSSIWYELGYDPATTYDFETRLYVQEEILKRIDAKLSEHAGTEYITDRTPLDMAGYTLGDAIGDRVPDSCQDRLMKYVNDCFASTNRHFGVVCLIQPGIPLKFEEGKAVLNQAYIEHLNSLIFGLTVDERLTAHHYYMPRGVVALEARLDALNSAVKRSKDRINVDYIEANKQGKVLIH